MNTNEDTTYYLNNYRTSAWLLKPGTPPTSAMARGWKEALRILRVLNPGTSNNEILAFARKATTNRTADKATSEVIAKAKKLVDVISRRTDCLAVDGLAEELSDMIEALTASISSEVA
jgi:hypothetical protein